jgi:hypothetical protein
VEPEIIEAIPEPVQEPEVTEATPKKTSWSSQSPQKRESTSSPKSQLFGSTSLPPKNSFVGKCFICELSVSHMGQLRQHISTVHSISEPLDKYLDLPPLKTILNINDPDSSIEIGDNLDSSIKLSKHPAKPSTAEKKESKISSISKEVSDSFVGFGPNQIPKKSPKLKNLVTSKTYAKTPEPAVKPEIVEATPQLNGEFDLKFLSLTFFFPLFFVRLCIT